jgi:hypothetical protein
VQLESLTLTNPLAYYDVEFIMTLKSLKVQAYGHNLLNYLVDFFYGYLPPKKHLHIAHLFYNFRQRKALSLNKILE